MVQNVFTILCCEERMWQQLPWSTGAQLLGRQTGHSKNYVRNKVWTLVLSNICMIKPKQNWALQ